ncbi:MAG: polysaccharide pyruvyl transferase CsaB [Paeniclostridium sordellii]|nr:polysaccharide pyruvyl transferase CsaB [Paeniclostridium sordellii]
MKVVISGYYGFDNIGDEAILKSIIMALKEEDESIEITVLSSNPQNTQENYGVKSINRWNLKKIYRELKKSDGLISGGGSLLQDVTSSRSILYYTFIMGLANKLSKPVVIYAQGVGPINKNANKKLVKYFLNKVQYISLRDEDSLELIKSIGVNKNIDLVPDPVMGLDFKSINKDSNEDYIIVSVRDWKEKNSYLKSIAKFCNDISKKGINIKLLPMHGNRDNLIAKELASMIEHEVDILSYEMNLENKLIYIKEAKLMIAMRLHALIFAGNVGTPMIGISYDPKIDSYLKLVNQPCIGSVVEGIDSKKLTEKTLYILKNHKSIKEDLKIHTTPLKLTAKLTASKVIKTFKIYKEKGEHDE